MALSFSRSTSVAVRALKRNLDLIVQSQLDLQDFATKLYSAELIPPSTYRSVMDRLTGMSSDSRMRQLLLSLEDTISRTDGSFDKLMNILEAIGSASTKAISIRLHDTYKGLS